MARPPVLIVDRNHAKVKCLRRWRRLGLQSCASCECCAISGLAVGAASSLVEVDMFGSELKRWRFVMVAGYGRRSCLEVHSMMVLMATILGAASMEGSLKVMGENTMLHGFRNPLSMEPLCS